MKPKVLIAAPVHPLLTEGLELLGYQLLIHENCTQTLGEELIKDCIGVVTSTRLIIGKELIDAAPKLRFVARMGSGMELIDVPYAEQKGIRCVSSPEGNCNSVAEHALGMLLCLNKNIAKSHQEIANGQWLREENRGTELEGKTIGIIGYGNTGKAFARLLSVFGMRILVYDKYVPIAPEAHIEVCNNLNPIFENAEILSFHIPLANENYHLLNDNFVQKMKNSFVLINTSRGTVVDNKKVINWLENGKIIAAGLDVWEQEPMSQMSLEYRNALNNLVKHPNIILTPHIAGYSHEALYKMSQILLERIAQ